MKETIGVLNNMEADAVIGRYAIAGAVAAYNYIEPTLTEDLDVLVAFSESSMKTGLITLEPIHSYLETRGYVEHEKEGVVIGGWCVQFLPIANDLDKEALASAAEIELGTGSDRVRTRVLKPEHLVATCLRVGRPKDLIRISQFLNESAVDLRALCPLLARHGLQEAWKAFCARTALRDPCEQRT